MVRGSLRLKGRMLAALLAMVALNAAFVVVVAWSYLVLLPTVVGGGYLYVVDGAAPSPWELVQLPFAPRWLAALTVAFLAGQVYYGYTRVLDDVRTSTVGPDEHPTLHAIVGRLAAAADVPKPAVSVVEGPTPNSFTVGRGHAATVVVTAPLLDLLDGAELEGVLAHEIAHVRHRDVTLVTITGLFVAVAERALQHARLLRRGVTDRERVSARQRLAFTWLLPVVAFTYVFLAPILWLFPPVARFASGELSRQREFAADRAAAELTGAPTALARALLAVHEASSDVVRADEAAATTDLRREHASLQALCVVPTGAVDVGAALRQSASSSGQSERDDAPAPGAAAVAGGGSTAPNASAPNASTAPDASTDPNVSTDPNAPTASNASTAQNAPTSSTTRATPSNLDPVEWLGTPQSDGHAGARTHPPIDERVRRLVDGADER